jgi:hypothetical protein
VIERRVTWTRLALLLPPLLGLALAVWVSVAVFEGIPHNEDELAFLFQSKVFARGAIAAPSPPIPSAFFAPFVIDRDGQRFGKYPPGYSLLLAPGSALGAEWLVNPLLGAASIALIVALGLRYFGAPAGALAGLLAALSPFFLEYAGSLMSHTATLFLLLLGIAAYAWAWERDSARVALAAGALFGLAFLSRPVTALGVGLPFALHAAWLSARGRWRSFGLPMAAGALPLAVLLLLYNHALTDQWRVSLYELWWDFDRYGFGSGIGTLGRHTPAMGLWYVKLNLLQPGRNGAAEIVLGWPLAPYSAYALLAVETLALGWALVRRRSGPRPQSTTLELLLLASAATLVLAYVPYWAPHPRYYYEALGGFYLLSALGALRLIGGARRFLGGPGPAFVALGGLMLAGALTTTPSYLKSLHGKNSFTRARLDAVQRADLHDALVFVVQQGDWSDYGSVFPANSPWLDGDVVYALETTPANRARLRAAFPGRAAYQLVGTQLSRLP